MKKITQFNRGKALNLEGQIKIFLRANLTLLDEKDIVSKMKRCIKYCEEKQDYETCAKLKKKLDKFLEK